MLIKCKECGLQVSDKAIICPHCGYPLRPDNLSKLRISSKPHRLPNGFGQITKLSNPNLKKPYRAMITVGKTEFGRPISKLLRPVAYFKTYNEAYEALAENAKSPYEIIKDITLEELHSEWKNDDAYLKLSDSMKGQYRTAWNYCSKLAKTKVSDIKAKQIKDCILADNVPDSVKNVLKILFNKLFDYAVENEIVDKNFARITKISSVGKYQVKNEHIAFTDEEMEILWTNHSNLYVKWILVQCLTGLRPDELCKLKTENINLDENYMIGGMKTSAGTNRTIPIHKDIKAIIGYLVNFAKNRECEYLLCDRNGTNAYYKKYKTVFNNIMKELGLNESHKPHDPRKYFITKAKEYQLDEYAIKRIVGHEISDVTEKIYTERSTDWLVDQINLIHTLD